MWSLSSIFSSRAPSPWASCFSSWQFWAPRKTTTAKKKCFGSFFFMTVRKKRISFSWQLKAGYSKYRSYNFDLSQILSPSNCSDWWLKSKLRLIYLQELWRRALTKKCCSRTHLFSSWRFRATCSARNPGTIEQRTMQGTAHWSCNISKVVSHMLCTFPKMWTLNWGFMLHVRACIVLNVLFW